MHLQGLGSGRGRTLSPQLIDQPLGAQRLVGVNHQQRQQRLLLGAPNRDTTLFIENFERSQDAKFHAIAGPLLAQTYPHALSCANDRTPRCYRAAAAQ